MDSKNTSSWHGSFPFDDLKEKIVGEFLQIRMSFTFDESNLKKN